MPEVAQIYLGNINSDSDLAKSVKQEKCLEISLPECDRNKGRIHGHVENGVAVGIIKSRDHALESGDVFKTDSGKLLLISLEEQEFLVLEFSNRETNTAPFKLVALGHALGNYHYPIKIQVDKIYVQINTDKLILEKLINGFGIAGLQLSYQTLSANQKIGFSFPNHS